MTPKEKATALVNQMYDVFNMEKYPDVLIDETDNETNDQLWDKNRELFESVYKRFAKQSALIAVDEIIKSTPQSPSKPLIIMPHFMAFQYWQEVKKEIEAL